MKILFDAQAFDMQTHGGVSRSFVELYKHMPDNVMATFGVRETDNVYLQSLDFPSAGYSYHNFISKRDFPLKKMFYKAYYNIAYGYPSRWDKRPFLNRYYSERLIKEGNFDVFHPTYFDDYFLEILGEKPFVLTIHDMIPELFPNYYPRNDFQIIQKSKLVSLAKHIVAVSEHTKEDLVRLLNVPEDKVTVVYHGVDEATYVPTEQNELNFEYLLYVGDRKFYKNFMAFCQACIPIFKKHGDLKVICTGKPFDTEEMQFFREKNVENRFVHHFVKAEQELMDLYHYAVAFVYPSAYEGFGIPILEAYKADCPVMLNRASCFPEIAGDAAVFFTIRNGKCDFGEQFEKLYYMTNDEREVLLNSQRQRMQKYSWSNSAKRLTDIYQRCT